MERTASHSHFLFSTMTATPPNLSPIEVADRHTSPLSGCSESTKLDSYIMERTASHSHFLFSTMTATPPNLSPIEVADRHTSPLSGCSESTKFDFWLTVFWVGRIRSSARFEHTGVHPPPSDCLFWNVGGLSKLGKGGGCTLPCIHSRALHSQLC